MECADDGAGVEGERRFRYPGATTGPSLVNRGEPGAKRHLIVDGSGIPLAYSTTPGNRHDVSQLWARTPGPHPTPDGSGRPATRQTRHAVRRPRQQPPRSPTGRLTRRGIRHRIARRGRAHGSGLGHICYVVERNFAWLHRYRRLAACYERRPDLRDALRGIGCILICWRHNQRSFKTSCNYPECHEVTFNTLYPAYGRWFTHGERKRGLIPPSANRFKLRSRLPTNELDVVRDWPGLAVVIWKRTDLTDQSRQALATSCMTVNPDREP